MYKANYNDLKKIFDSWKRSGNSFVKFDDILKVFIKQIEWDATEQQVTMAIAYSKMWFVEELEQMQSYKRVVFAEFLDFLARLSFLVWPDDDEDMSQKIWRIM